MSYFKKIEKDIVRSQILKDKSRIDGRKLDEVRNISFRSLMVAKNTWIVFIYKRWNTSNSCSDSWIWGRWARIEALQGSYKENFMLHYNFPPYSVGEVGRMGSAGRREIGHGKLAWRALESCIT